MSCLAEITVMNDDEFIFQASDRPPDKMFARFILHGGDTITIEGVSIPHVYFEMQKRFPEGFDCKAIGFSGKDKEDSAANLKKFLDLTRKYK